MPGTCTSRSWALKAFGLDRVWWLVSPGNPLKPDAPADLARRLAAARAIMRHPRVEVTDLEARLGTRYTAATLAALKARWPGVRFVWLMGADNLAGFHRWERWDEIMAAVPVGVLARPGDQLRAGLSPAARRFARWRLPAARGAGAAVPRAAGLDAGERADARPVVERAARARGVAAVSRRDRAAGAAGRRRRPGSRRRRCRARGGRGRAAGGDPRRLGARRRVTGFALADLESGALHRGAPGGGAAAARVGGEGGDDALRARRARARTTASAPRSAPPGRSRAGVLQGDLVLAGGGDPVLDTDALGGLVRRAARAAGSARSRGGSWSPTGRCRRWRRSTAASRTDAAYNPTISGMNLNFNRVFLAWAPGRQGRRWRSARPAARFEVPVGGIRAELVDGGAAAAPLRGRARGLEPAAGRASAAGAASGCRCAAPGAYAGEVFRAAGGAAGLALPEAEVVAAAPGGGDGGARERRARADAARHAALFDQPDGGGRRPRGEPGARAGAGRARGLGRRDDRLGAGAVRAAAARSSSTTPASATPRG